MPKNNLKNYQEFCVSGMHCAACSMAVKNLLESDLKINKVWVDSHKNTVKIESSEPLNLDYLNSRLSNFSYSLRNLNEAFKFRRYSFETIMMAILIIAVIMVTYLIINDVFSGFETLIFLNFLNNNSYSTFTSFFILGVVASVTTCAALVGSLVATLSKNWTQSNKLKLILSFHLGRILSFYLLGVILGLIGMVIGISVFFMSFVTILISLLMIYFALQTLGINFNVNFKHKLSFKSGLIDKIKLKFDQFFKNSHKGAIVYGFLSFFIPCGYTLFAQSNAILAGNPQISGILMLGFALGTMPALLFLSFTGFLISKNQSFSQALGIVVSFFIIIISLYNLNSQLNVFGLPSINDVLGTSNALNRSGSNLGVKISEKNGNLKQEVFLHAEAFNYYPKAISLESGINTTFNVSVKDIQGCAQSMWLGGLYDKPIYLVNNELSKIENLFPKKGKYKISCTMGMVSPIIVTVN